MGYICNMKYMGNMETWHAKIFRNKMNIQKCLYNGNCINIAQKIRCTEMFYNDSF